MLLRIDGEQITPVFTCHFGYILIVADIFFHGLAVSFTFHSGYILILLFFIECSTVNTLYIPLWLYINDP